MKQEEKYLQLNQWIKHSKYIVFLGGAGVSTESGIPDFRSKMGVERSLAPEVVLSYSYFINHPKEFYEFYCNQMIYSMARPNTAHYILAKMEEKNVLKAVITQNIDGLHQQAGSKNVIELHGSIYRNICMKCGLSYDITQVIAARGSIPYCECGGIVKPEVTLYEEPLNMTTINTAISYISKADMLIVGGSSLVVYPAAGLIDYFKGDKLVIINHDKTPYDQRAGLLFRESIGVVCEQINI